MQSSSTTNDGMRKARILIVDDHPMMREGMTIQIAHEPDLVVCGEADDVEPALQLARELSPDLIIIDISLKTSNGLELIKRLRDRNSTSKILVNSMYDENIYAERALQAGAMGYINKMNIGATFITAVRMVLNGKTYLSPEMTDRVLKNRVGGIMTDCKSPIENLSNRELEVLRLIGQGKTTRAIANMLLLSVHTIDTHREKIKKKLNLANSVELNRFAAQWVLENG